MFDAIYAIPLEVFNPSPFMSLLPEISWDQKLPTPRLLPSIRARNHLQSPALEGCFPHLIAIGERSLQDGGTKNLGKSSKFLPKKHDNPIIYPNRKVCTGLLDHHISEVLVFKVYLFGLFFNRKPANLSKDGISTVSLWSPTAAILRSQTRRLPHRKAVTIPGPCVCSIVGDNWV